MTDAERLNDIAQKLRCYRYLGHYPHAERDVAWLIEQLAERDARIAELEARLQLHDWGFSLPRWLLLAEGHLTRRLFRMIVRRLVALSVPAG